MSRSRARDDGRSGAGVVGVVGARGGAGATVTAAALAAHLARRGPTVLVQIGPGPGIDTMLGLEGRAGLRWPDLTAARGAIDAEHLAANLMRWDRCAVLSTDDARPGPPPPEVLPDVLEALAAAHGSVVLDLDRSALLTPERGSAGPGPGRDLLDACGVLLLVVPRDVPGVAGARLLRTLLSGRGTRIGVVTRGPAPGGLGTAEVAEALDLPVVATLPWARGIGAAIDRGVGPEFPALADRALARLAGRLA